jgi:hypothetical protein
MAPCPVIAVPTRNQNRSRTANAKPPTSPDVYVEPWPGGGWTVRIAGHAVPVSRHDSEEEALERAAAYRRGLKRERTDAGGPGVTVNR